jgi:hypothetical protein
MLPSWRNGCNLVANEGDAAASSQYPCNRFEWHDSFPSLFTMHEGLRDPEK